MIRSKGNTAYFLDVGSTKVPVYCHMTTHGLDACGGGGWTLVMKIDGSKVLKQMFLQLAWFVIKVKCSKADQLCSHASTSLLPLLPNFIPRERLALPDFFRTFQKGQFQNGR